MHREQRGIDLRRRNLALATQRSHGSLQRSRIDRLNVLRCIFHPGGLSTGIARTLRPRTGVPDRGQERVKSIHILGKSMIRMRLCQRAKAKR